MDLFLTLNMVFEELVVIHKSIVNVGSSHVWCCFILPVNLTCKDLGVQSLYACPVPHEDPDLLTPCWIVAFTLVSFTRDTLL